MESLHLLWETPGKGKSSLRPQGPGPGLRGLCRVLTGGFSLKVAATGGYGMFQPKAPFSPNRMTPGRPAVAGRGVGGVWRSLPSSASHSTRGVGFLPLCPRNVTPHHIRTFSQEDIRSCLECSELTLPGQTSEMLLSGLSASSPSLACSSDIPLPGAGARKAHGHGELALPELPLCRLSSP